MPKKTYGCTDCNKTFSRKYNAERHNETIHNQMAKIYNKETGWKLNNKKTNINSQVQQDSLLLTPSNTTTTTSDIENENNINAISNPMSEPVKDFDLLDSLTSVYNIKEIKGTFKILSKMLPFMDEMDSLLLTFNPKNRINILSNIIITSLTSPNPVRALKDYINFYRIIIGIEKASTIVSASQGIPKDAAKIFLKSCINTSEYSKINFNNSNNKKNEKY